MTYQPGQGVVLVHTSDPAHPAAAPVTRAPCAHTSTGGTRATRLTG
jgi:hypothetical protein